MSGIRGRLSQGVVLLAAIVSLTACPVSSTSVTDANLIATFLVQNDNGQGSATVTFESRDLAGTHAVDLVAGESVWYEHQKARNELRKISDGKYAASLPSEITGWFSFSVRREDEELLYREVDDNHVYLPETFQSLQVEPLQFGPVIRLNWALSDNSLQSISGFTAGDSEDTFNAIATCQVENESIALAITEGNFVQQNGMSLLEIPVTEYLQQVAGLSTVVIAATTCEFDIQLVRTLAGDTDVYLNRRSSASGQVLQNIAVQWAGQ